MGQEGPWLDQIKPSADIVKNQVQNPVGGMPGGLATGKDLDDVSAYVAHATGVPATTTATETTATTTTTP